MVKAPHKIGIPPNLRVLYVERHEAVYCEKSAWPDDRIKHGHYRLWLHTSDRILGTYLALWDNGKIERVTVRDNEGDQVDLIKGPD